MLAPSRTITWLILVTGAAMLAAWPARPGPRADSYWSVDEVRPGMKGTGRTVMKGTRVEPFDAEVLGILKNVSPGRDLVLCRLSGLNLDHTGVIAGMSGSPVYIDGKLLGAVAYAWPYGKEPIAGVTPFSQMHAYAEAFERSDMGVKAGSPRRFGLGAPVTIDGQAFDAVTVAQGFDEEPAGKEGLWMVPLRTPLAATGFTPHSLKLLGERLRGTGLVPVMGGAVAARIADDESETPLEPGGPLAVALVSGDFDVSGIGTVTHIEDGGRVYGWGHPFMSLGQCSLPLMTGYIHTIYPRQSVSFKMGSPLRTVGLITADVSTGIAGWLGPAPDLMPLRMNVAREWGQSQTFNVRIARHKSLLPTLVFTCLTNSVDMEGELPEELTAHMQARVDIEGREPIVISDTYSGSSYSGGRAPQALYYHVASLVNQLTYNPYQPLKIRRIDCETTIEPGRTTADIEAVELNSDLYAPGDTVRGTVFIRPYKDARQRLPIELKLPADLAEGAYTATVCDGLTGGRLDLQHNPNLSNPQSLDHLFESVQALTAAKRTQVVLRVPISAGGVALKGQSLPDLPPSMVHILAQTRRTGAQPLPGALVSRHETDWVLSGTETVKFFVTKNKKISGNPGG